MTRIPITYNDSPELFADTAEITGISQTTAILRTTGDNATGTMYAAVRTSGVYQSTDQALVSAGTGATWFENTENAYHKSFLVVGLQPGTT
jgi:hypothetical protein